MQLAFSGKSASNRITRVIAHSFSYQHHDINEPAVLVGVGFPFEG